MPEMISQIDDEIVALKSLRDATNQSKESNTISIANNRSEVFQNQIFQSSILFVILRLLW